MWDAFKEAESHISDVKSDKIFGKVASISGLLVEAKGLPQASIGSRCLIEDRFGHKKQAEVVGYKEERALLMPYGSLEGIGPNCPVYLASDRVSLKVNSTYVGRVIDALGHPIDGQGPLGLGGLDMPLKASPPPAGARQSVGHKMDVGVRALNTFLSICEGQRMGIFAGSGVGKSTLMSMVAKYASADVNVIALVGERGREVREFILESLGEEGLKRSIIVVATSDEPPLMRRQAAYTAMTIAEYFRDEGKNVMLMMDSVTRFAMAQREIGLSAGEPPTTKGYTPSVFAELPRLLERAGPSVDKGSITAIFTVLVEGGDMEEPIADAVRGILDGHILLSRTLAERGHFPAIDVLKSVSRTMPKCNTEAENKVVRAARELYSTYTDMEELIRLGAYKKGADPLVDQSIEYAPKIKEFLQQSEDEKAELTEGYQTLKAALSPLADEVDL